MRDEKSTFSAIFIILVVMLVSLPFITTFQDILTRIVMWMSWYKALQAVVVPYEMNVLASLLSLMHIKIQVGNAYIQFDRSGVVSTIYLIWNCVGWQSFVVFIMTLITGFSGNFTLTSKGESFLIGILGTYLINILRLVLVVVMYYFTGQGIGLVFHDYFSSFLSIAWLFFFWWFSYAYVLERKPEVQISTDL